MESLNQDFLEFIALLERHEVRYLIVGGYAVGLHGFPRYTGDIDFFVAISERNATRIMRVFQDFGFGGIGLEKADFLQESFVVEVGREPRKIQVLTGIDGVSFEECYAGRREFDYHGQRLQFIAYRDLLTNKEASGRAKDQLDVMELKRLHEPD